MDWDTVSNKSTKKRSRISPPLFQTLRWRLLGSYLLVMTAILVISDVAIYEFFAESLYQQADRRLLDLADAAGHSLHVLKENPRALDRVDYRFDGDGDLDIPWQNLRQNGQSIEWFNERKQRLTHAGTLNLKKFPMIEGFQTLYLQKNGETIELRTVTIAIPETAADRSTIAGYVRAGESGEAIEAVLGNLRLGFYAGGIGAFGLIALGGLWLTGQSLKPIVRNYRQLEQFTADASHELRGPITTIKASAEVLQTHPERIHPTDAGKIQGILSASEQMSRLVEDLLLLARVDSSPRTMDRGDAIPLDELLEDTIDFLDLKAENKEQTLQFLVVRPVSVRGNPARLQRLFSNLIDNAIKYTPDRGKITVTLDRVDKFALVRVEDTGIGIAREHIPLVFDRFWREESARSYQDGSGLGLAICQSIVRDIGGEITVSSQVGAGSCFQVRLPIA